MGKNTEQGQGFQYKCTGEKEDIKVFEVIRK